MKTENLDDLKLFNEKAAWLLSSSFADAMLRKGSGFMFSWKAGEGCEAVLVGAEGESVDAAFLTLRMFLQKTTASQLEIWLRSIRMSKSWLPIGLISTL